MSIRVNNISLNIEEHISKVKKKVAKKVRLKEGDLRDFKILKESIDARKKNNIKFNYCVEFTCDNEEKLINKLNDKDLKLDNNQYDDNITPGDKKLNHRPIVVGTGPSGLFAALMLAEKGYKPLVIERGGDVDERSKSVDKFWKTGELDTESNVQFGEGGAGTFSDGKLTTRIKDNRCDYVTRKFVEAGAPEEILYKGKPHIGTDILKDVTKNIRERIKSLGGEVCFNSRLEDIIHKDGKIKSVIVNKTEIPCEALVLAIGHSSRDTYEMLYKRGIFMTAKPFAIGVRVEHPQEIIDVSQYGEYAGHPRLKAADYRLTHNSKDLGRGIYSFCMCPGGVVVAAASEENRLVTNGMSYYARDKENANSALVVAVRPDDFEGSSPLAGMEFQRHYEELAYKVGGGNYMAPLQLIGDFMNDRVSTKLGNVNPSYKPGFEFRDLRETLPSYVISGLKEGIVNFERKIHGFSRADAILTGIETRTSAPVRIERNDKYESISVKGLYPAGEGAGHAGGIMSAAVDGIRIAESIIKEYNCNL